METTKNPKGLIQPNWLEIISAPIDAKRIKWKVQTKQKEGKYIMYVCYLDSRICIERLNEAFGGAWSTHYEDKTLPGKNVPYTECTITVQFPDYMTSRTDRGSAADIEPEKSSVSNSLKRTSGQWGLGAELYELPKVLVESKKNGNYVNELCSKANLNKALANVPQVYNESKELLEFVWIDARGDIYSVNDYKGKGELLMSLTSTKTTKKAVKKVVKKETPAPAKKPPLSDFPAFNSTEKKPIGGKAWNDALNAWNGKILTSKPDEKGATFAYVMLKGYSKVEEKSFHKLTKGQLELLIAHNKYEA